MRPENLVFNSFNAIAKSDWGILVSHTDIKQFDKENKCYLDKVIGARLQVVLPAQGYEKISVVIPTGFEDLLVENAKIAFQNFDAHFHRDFNTGEYSLTAKATGIAHVK